MPDERVLERIDAWQAAGLIDGSTADRLRAAEAATETPSQQTDRTAAGGEALPALLGSIVGPSPTITEVFAYVGAGFVLAAWHVLAAAWRPLSYPDDAIGPPPPDLVRVSVEWVVPALVLAIVGWRLIGRGGRWRRAAAVAFAAATVHVSGAAAASLPSDIDFRLVGVLAGVPTIVAAALFRARLPALLTQVTLLVTMASFAGSTLAWLEPRVFGEGDYGIPGGTPAARGLATTAWWIAWAIAWGLLGRWEAMRARLATDETEGAAALRRADVTRFGAGLAAVLGTTYGLVFADRFDAGALEPWVGDAILLAISAVLVGLAIRLASPYLYPGALGIIIGLTSLNAVYIAEQTGIGVALLAEGSILIGAGFVADRLRRRIAAARRGASLL